MSPLSGGFTGAIAAKFWCSSFHLAQALDMLARLFGCAHGEGLVPLWREARKKSKSRFSMRALGIQGLAIW